ncbi:colicin I receptor [Candidatus Phycosocius bacilliformis]|uniref:Colicin I receptor n=1 Tax=Candidatus Phycosocius bacilliformis TaxID=1445552 RepID=A0A2P2E925_9PROT|nr:TonB-dependent receptor [Candidatus Phycosocius bacilliformis]GBF57548.1 colicin I receptor [Candidatus Phycosocius bacilliformis]
MSRNALRSGASALLAIFMTTGATQVFAQTATSDEAPKKEVEVVVVTGTFIRGTSESASLPVNVISSADLEKAGTPSTVELIKLLNVSSGVQGDTNQFDSRAQGNEGAGSVNLRGIGPERTLVLLNGRRMAYNPFGLVGTVVDTNLIPSAAIGRVEVLKDGAAATYGSDAVAGVVNFITRTNLEGFEVGGDYKAIDGSDGNYTASLAWGHKTDRAKLFVSLGLQKKTELPVTARDWANRDYLSNPEGGWSAAGNPGTYIAIGPTGGPVSLPTREPNCTPLGGFAGFSGSTPVCFFHFTPYDNLVEKEERSQFFASADVTINENHALHGEILISNTNTPEWKTSPSYAFLQAPSAQALPTPSGLPGRFFVPATNPGYIDLLAKNPGLFPASAIGVNMLAYRPFSYGGNPKFTSSDPRGGSQGERSFEAVRVSVGLKGKLTESINYDVNLAAMDDTGIRTGYDVLVNRFQLALRGLGGPNCNVAANTPGANGCQWFSPFGTAIPGNSVTGVVNPQYNAALGAANAALVDWFYPEVRTKQTSSLVVFDAVLNGELGIQLGDGPIGWAAGYQYRKNSFRSDFSKFSDLTQQPCVSSPDFNNNVCAAITGPTVFLSGSFPANVSADVNAAFFELRLPFSERFEAQIAGRYEDFGGKVGSTFNPKLSAKWQMTDTFALRGSTSTTFRAPSVSNIQPTSVTTLQSILGTFRAVDIFGNPDLEPETATTYNVGALFDSGHLRASVDYWRFDFDNPIVNEPIAGLVAALFPTTGAGNCGNSAFAAIQAKFTFSGGVCNSANISRLNTTVINGSPLLTDGIDVSIDYMFENVMGGDLKLGLDATYTMSYDIDALFIGGVKVAEPLDAVGKLNFQTTAYPLPQYKGTLYGLYETGGHSLRLAMNFIDEYEDQRTAPFAASLNYSATAGTTAVISSGKTIKGWQSFDLNYRWAMDNDLTFTFGIENILDRDPSFARLELNYDPFTGNPLGRTYKIGLKKAFGGPK